MFSVCVGVMGEAWFSFFSCVSFHASVLYTCFSMPRPHLHVRIFQNCQVSWLCVSLQGAARIALTYGGDLYGSD